MYVNYNRFLKSIYFLVFMNYFSFFLFAYLICPNSIFKFVPSLNFFLNYLKTRIMYIIFKKKRDGNFEKNVFLVEYNLRLNYEVKCKKKGGNICFSSSSLKSMQKKIIMPICFNFCFSFHPCFIYIIIIIFLSCISLAF